MKKIFFIVCSLVLFFSPSLSAFAVGDLVSGKKNLTAVANLAGTTNDDLSVSVGTLINGALTLVGIIFLILMVYAGFLWMTARGEEDQIEKAQKIIYGTVIGLVIVVSAYAITVFVTSRFGASTAASCKLIPASASAGCTEGLCTATYSNSECAAVGVSGTLCCEWR